MQLDSLSKILIATGQINYMAASIDSVNEQIKMLPDAKGFHADGIREKDEHLADVAKRLATIMEDMGNLINSCDAICEIDERVAKVPFEILVHGMDDTDKDYSIEAE